MRTKIALVTVAVAAGIALAIAFAPRKIAEEAAGPRALRLGEEECAACHMILTDPHFAAQRVLGPDDVKVYDDSGCLLKELARDRRGALWFAEADTGEWIDGSDVRFERTTRTTPMGFGLAARRSITAPKGSMDLEAAIRFVTDSRKEKSGS